MTEWDNSYRQYLNSEHWKNTRERLLERHGAYCDCCGSTDNINVHHLTYKNIGKENDYELIVLCHRCHQIMHDQKRKRRLANEFHDVIYGDEVQEKIKELKQLIKTKIGKVVAEEMYDTWGDGMVSGRTTRSANALIWTGGLFEICRQAFINPADGSSNAAAHEYKVLRDKRR